MIAKAGRVRTSEASDRGDRDNFRAVYEAANTRGVSQQHKMCSLFVDISRRSPYLFISIRLSDFSTNLTLSSAVGKESEGSSQSSHWKRGVEVGRGPILFVG